MNLPQFNLRRWQHFIALGFGSGLAPVAPGTVGTIVAMPLVWLLMLGGLYWHIGFIIVGTALGVYVCGKASADIHQPDHSSIVWDEFIGFAITMLLVPPGWLTLLLGFALFRLFDILKPWPIRWFDQKVHNGLGIMLDDMLAGVAACVTLHLLLPFVGIN